MLVPTLYGLADALVFRDRVAAYSHEQDRQDRQNEGDLTGAAKLRVFWDGQMRVVAPIVRKTRAQLLEMYPKADQ